MPEVMCTASPIRFWVRATACLQSPLSRHPFARWAMRSFRIHAEVRLDDNRIALVFDQLVVVDTGHSGRIRGSAGVVRAEEFEPVSWLVLREEQSPSLVDIDDRAGLSAVRPRDVHSANQRPCSDRGEHRAPQPRRGLSVLPGPVSSASSPARRPLVALVQALETACAASSAFPGTRGPMEPSPVPNSQEARSGPCDNVRELKRDHRDTPLPRRRSAGP